MAVATFKYQGSQEVEDVLSLLLQIVKDIKAGNSITDEIMGNLVTFIGLVPELRSLPEEAKTELPAMLASGMVNGSLIVQALLKK